MINYTKTGRPTDQTEMAVQEQAAADRIVYAVEREAWGREVKRHLAELRIRRLAPEPVGPLLRRIAAARAVASAFAVLAALSNAARE